MLGSGGYGGCKMGIVPSFYVHPRTGWRAVSGDGGGYRLSAHGGGSSAARAAGGLHTVLTSIV